MPHLHKLETWRHPLTKQRATVAHIHGTRDCVALDIYAFRARYGVNAGMFACASDARAELRQLGFKHPVP